MIQVIAMLLPCYCHVIAKLLSSYCQVLVKLLRRYLPSFNHVAFSMIGSGTKKLQVGMVGGRWWQLDFVKFDGWSELMKIICFPMKCTFCENFLNANILINHNEKNGLVCP